MAGVSIAFLKGKRELKFKPLPAHQSTSGEERQ